MIGIGIAVIAILVVLEAVLVAGPFCRDLIRAGGWRALLAELQAAPAPPAAPARQSPQPAVPWYLDAHAGRPAACWEPAERPEVAGVPPWHPDAASLTTGYTRWHAQSLKELLNGEAS